MKLHRFFTPLAIFHEADIIPTVYYSLYIGTHLEVGRPLEIVYEGKVHDD